MASEHLPCDHLVAEVLRSTHALAQVTERLTSLGDQIETAGHAFVAFGHELYRQAEVAYRAAHGRLPGSMKTARLRKKRQTLVWRWYRAQLEGRGRGRHVKTTR